MSVSANTCDPIVVGFGIGGGWAAKELTGLGLKVLMLERGRNVRHIEDCPTAVATTLGTATRWQDLLGAESEISNPQSRTSLRGRCHFRANEADQPCREEKPFDGFRGEQVGGPH